MGFLSCVTGVIIGAVIVHVWIFNLHPHVLFGVWFSSWSAGVGTWSMWVLSWRWLGWLWMWPIAISGLITWRVSMCGWSVMWSMWCVTVRSMAVASIGRVQSLWDASGVVASIPVLWSNVAFVGIMMTQFVMSSKMRLWSGSASPVSVFTVLSWTWSGMATSGTFVVSHWGSWRRYHMWTIHDNVTIFVALIAPNMRASSCYMSLFLVLESVIFFMRHHIDCEGGMIIAVNCCAALSFSTSEMASVSVWGPFS